MLVYEHARTELIINRLRGAERFARIVAVVTGVITFASAAILITGAASTNQRAIGGIVGALLGFVIGAYAMVVISAVIEWMCQMLIAQGSLVDATTRARQ